MSRPILTLAGLEKRYALRGGPFAPKRFVHAVNGIDLDIMAGETLGLVGESGCGKSTLARLIDRLEEPSAGRVTFHGGAEMGEADPALRFRRAVQMVFQDPYSSMNPRMSVGRIIAEPLDNFGLGTREQRRDKVAGLLSSVGLDPAAMDAYPHEFSGGQRQRIAIARALALDPEVVIADEPVSALDVSVQAQVLNLIADIRAARGLTLIFVSHDLSVVRHLSDRIAVMYLGRIVEIGPADDVFSAPVHPYAQALMAAIPPEEPGEQRARTLLSGDIPAPTRLPSGCAFHTRCPLAVERCRIDRPALRPLGDGRSAACHFAQPAPNARTQPAIPA